MRLREDAICDVAQGDLFAVKDTSLFLNHDIPVGERGEIHALYVFEGIQVAVLIFPGILESQDAKQVPAREYLAVARGLEHFIKPIKAA